MKLIFRTLGCLLIAGLCLAASATAQKAQAVMTNEDVISLVSAGMPDDVVIAKIKTSPSPNFDTSVTALKALKAAGVSSTVIRVMIDPHAASGPSAAPSNQFGTSTGGSVDVDKDDPLAPHGGYWLQTKGQDGQLHMRELLMTAQTDQQMPGAASYLVPFGKSKIKSIIPGTKAEIQISDTSPVFYIYPGNVSIQGTGIVKLTVNAKKDQREVTNMTMGGLFGTDMKGGASDKERQSAKFEMVKEGVYKVTFASPLEIGSYAFASKGATYVYYDFDIISP